MANAENVIGSVVVQVLCAKVKRAVKYCSEKLTIKATKRCADRKQTIVVVTIGRPNAAERKFIKLAKKAGEPFPVAKIQLKMAKSK